MTLHGMRIPSNPLVQVFYMTCSPSRFTFFRAVSCTSDILAVICGQGKPVAILSGDVVGSYVKEFRQADLL